MRTFLKDFSKYEVKSSLDRESFLRKANLTNAEKKYLSDHLGALELCYKFEFKQNEELLMFCIEISMIDDQYTEERVVRSITSALPYSCIVGVQSGFSIKFWLSARKRNTRNSGRSVIQYCDHSPRLATRRDDRINRRIISAFNTAVYHRDSVKEAFACLSNAFDEAYICLRESIEEGEVQLDEDSLDNYKDLSVIRKTNWGYVTIGPEEQMIMCEINEAEQRWQECSFEDEFFLEIEDDYD